MADEVLDELLVTVIGIGVGFVVAVVAVRAVWRVRSAIRLRRADDEPLHSATAMIWRDPGAVELLDLAAGPGGGAGAPVPPFTFLEELFTGSRPGVALKDARGRTWRVKWGDEVQVEALATRLAWAAGYFVETTYFVPAGRIEGARDLERAASLVDGTGAFRDARFELDEDNVIKHFDEHSWAWTDNPFVGTRELNGLKIVMMWLSNWDAKDVRDVSRGSNTAIFEYPARPAEARPAAGAREGGAAAGGREARYLVIDWGGALGKWGNIVNRGRWDPAGFSEQTPHFVEGVDAGIVRWGYTGQRTTDIAADIRVSDVGWLLGYLERLQPAQIVAAVEASGGTSEEAAAFAASLVERVAQLRRVARIPQACCGTIDIRDPSR